MLLLGSVAFGSERGNGGVEGEPAWWLVALFTFQGIVIWLFAHRRYLVRKDGELRPAFTELQEFGTYLLSGAVISQLWVHGDPQSYAATMHAVLLTIAPLDLEVTLHFLANEVIMTFFFGIAAKELAEATSKKQGSLRGRKGFLPLVACAGGVVGPAVVYRAICAPEMTGAWGVPCATDIAFAWLGARAIWGPTHPAVTFILALAIADDFIGMGIIAVAYPQRSFYVIGLLLLALGMALAWRLNRAAGRHRLLRTWQAYVIPGAVCWFGLFFAGLHPSLALVFVVPFMPMRDRDMGLFAEEEDERATDAISRFEHSHKPFVDTGLFFFGLANAGVAWWGSSAWDQNSWAVFLGLGIGKTVGIVAFTVIGYLLLRLTPWEPSLPENPATGETLRWSDVPIVGLLGAIGFTVALFVAEAAGGQPALKLGALASFAYLAVATVLGKLIVVRRARATG